MTDSVFGSMFLNGCNPNVVQRCEKLPSNFPVTEEMVKSVLDRGLTLEQEIKVRCDPYEETFTGSCIECQENNLCSPLPLILG